MPTDTLRKDIAFTGVYAFSHFTTDFACVATVLFSADALSKGALDPVMAFFAVLLYDMVAFCFQLPVGMVLDNLNRNAAAGVFSALLVMSGVLMCAYNPAGMAIPAALLAAFGNAIFHSAGGIDVLHIAKGRASLPGSFIATGAAGVFFASWVVAGMPLANAAGMLSLLLAMSAFAMLCLDVQNDRVFHVSNPDFSLPKADKMLIAAAICLFITVGLRSYVGMIMAFPWKGEVFMGLVAILAVVAGKTFGGFIADRIGFVSSSVISLGVSALLFLGSWDVPTCGIIGTFLFNFTMPITLTAMADMFPNAKGTAFGLASFALALGAAPALLGASLASPIWLCVLAFVSLAAILAGLKFKDSYMRTLATENVSKSNVPHGDDEKLEASAGELVSEKEELHPVEMEEEQLAEPDENDSREDEEHGLIRVDNETAGEEME